MTAESIFILANKYENDQSLSPYEKHMMREALNITIKNVLRKWSFSVPEEKYKLFGDRLKRPVEFIKTRGFHTDYIWHRAKELAIHYETDGEIDMIISITPNLLLIKDKNFYMREAAFPIEWI